MRLHLQREVLVAALLLTAGSALSAAPRLQLNTSSVGPIFVVPGTNGPVQTVQAFNGGTGNLNLSAAVSAPWLAATVGTAASCTFQTGTCYPISISLNTSTLASGSYTEYVTVSDPNAVDSPLQISVNVVIASVPKSITLNAAPNGGTATATIFPQTPVVGQIITQSGGNWLTFTTPKGQVTFGSPFTITATSLIGMAPGTYLATVIISGSANSADNGSINVTFNVTSSPIVPINNTQIVMNGYAGGPASTTTIPLSNSGQGTLSVTAASVSGSPGNGLSASVVGGNSIVVTANPAQLAAGIYTGTVTVSSNAANSAQISIPIEFTVAAAGSPTIFTGGIVNNATFTATPLAPGEIASVFGDQFTTQLSATFVNPGPPPLATRLGGVQVLFNGVPAPLYFVSRQQINFQVPYETPAGQLATVQIMTSGPVANTRSVQVSDTGVAPHILVWPASVIAGGYGIEQNADNTISLPPGVTGLGATRTSKPGDVIVIYCTGLGQTIPFATTGTAAPASPIETTAQATVIFGGQVSAQSAFAGLTPGFVGLYQVNVQIPANVPTGTSVTMSLAVGSTVSNTVNIDIASH